MADRPNYLVVVQCTAADSIDVFAAYVRKEDAEAMRDRLEALLMTTNNVVHVIPVPDTEGLCTAPPSTPVADKHRAEARKKAEEPPVTSTEPAKPPVPFRRLSQDAFIAETEAMLENGGWRDADAPLSDGGAIS